MITTQTSGNIKAQMMVQTMEQAMLGTIRKSSIQTAKNQICALMHLPSSQERMVAHQRLPNT
jgi:hypothetical protein